MNNENTTNFIKSVLENMPSDWLKLTTHRLDIYNEKRAKIDFLECFEALFLENYSDKDVLKAKLKELPTAFDYIRLGHPLSCALEWSIAKSKDINVESVISFSSEAMPILAILRKNSLENKETQIIYKSHLPECLSSDVLKNVYDYKYDLVKINDVKSAPKFNGSCVLLTEMSELSNINLNDKVDFVVGMDSKFGSVALVNGEKNESYIGEIQHVRRRESIAMTPRDCFRALKIFIGDEPKESTAHLKDDNRSLAIKNIKDITNTTVEPSIGSCGLSVQYAIMMGLVHNSLDAHPKKEIKFLVPPNCYGGTNDQARRVAACIDNVEVVDLPVDAGNDMVSSIESVLEEVANMDAVPYIIAEIPTNPRVEVPNLDKLVEALSKKRKTKEGEGAISPVFILDQTFCPNVKFLGEGNYLEKVKTISYVSGSKFPSGGLCTAGYCVANNRAQYLMSYIDKHLNLCGNTATDFQVETLANQMPSMNQRISDAYKNTREFVNFIHETLPEAKINFVSEQLAQDGFTPSVFSLDLPTKGNTPQEKEANKRELNLKLITLMINEIPHESKHCVSYGQLKGCYWTIPATSTQGTTKEGDKDYIVRVSVSPVFNLELHKNIFTQFCKESYGQNNS